MSSSQVVPGQETFEVSKAVLDPETFEKVTKTAVATFTPLVSETELAQYDSKKILELVNKSLRREALVTAKASILGPDPSAFNAIVRNLKPFLSVDSNGAKVAMDAPTVDKVKTRARIVAALKSSPEIFEGLKNSVSAPAAAANEDEDDD